MTVLSGGTVIMISRGDSAVSASRSGVAPAYCYYLFGIAEVLLTYRVRRFATAREHAFRAAAAFLTARCYPRCEGPLRGRYLSPLFTPRTNGA